MEARTICGSSACSNDTTPPENREVNTNFYRIAITGALTMDPRITTVGQLRAATDRVLAKPTENPTLNEVVRCVNREQAYLAQLADGLDVRRRSSCFAAMDRTWIHMQFLVAQANREPVKCGHCGQPIERSTDAMVRWIGDDSRDEREILHANADLCITEMVKDVA